MTNARLEAILRSLLSIVVLLSIQACGRRSNVEDVPASYIRIVIDESEPEQLLSYYFGGYVVPEPMNPFNSGMLAEIDGNIYVDMDTLGLHFPGGSTHLADENGDNRLDWGELEAFIDATYNDARNIPPTLDSMHRAADFSAGDDRWMNVDVDGVMTVARRRIYIEEAAIREALDTYYENDERIIYPEETTIFGEHYIDAGRVETTVMRKRADGFWDYAVYGANDSLSRGTATPPKELKAPVQCVGCHFGSRLFEPEKSFPVLARRAPDGPRHLHVDDALRDTDAVRYFDEHRKRSDTILGLYTTLFVADLRRQQREGRISESDAALLERFDIE